MARYTFPQGTTEALDIQLYRRATPDADRVPLVGTGLTLGYVLVDSSGAAVTLAGTVAWLDQAAGTVRVLLDAADLPEAGSIYRMRFTITDGLGRLAYNPNGRSPDEWHVVPAA